MAFPGAEKLSKDAEQGNGGGYIKMPEDKPFTVIVLSYQGAVTSKNKDGKEQTQYVFSAAEHGVVKKLYAGWRLRDALMAHVKELLSPFEVTITRSKVLEEVTIKGVKQKVAVNQFKLTNVKPVATTSPQDIDAASDEESPF
jgi:hypothetical protein